MQKDSLSVSLAHEVQIALTKAGADLKHFWKRIPNDKELARKLVDLALGDRFEIIVDYEKSAEELIKDDYYFESLRYRCPKDKWELEQWELIEVLFGRCQGKGKKKVIIRLFSWSDCDNLDFYQGVIKGITEDGCRPANIRELHALGEQYPNLYRRYSLCAPGSVGIKNSYIKIPSVYGTGEGGPLKVLVPECTYYPDRAQYSHFAAVESEEDC